MNRTYPFDIGAAEAIFIRFTVEANNCVVAQNRLVITNKPAFDLSVKNHALGTLLWF